MKLKIEIDLDGLTQTNISHDDTSTKYLPTVSADYNTLEGLNNQKVWYKEYKKGAYKFIRMEGRGETPESCTDIIIRMSPGNQDVLYDNPTGYHPDYGEFTYDDYPENMYIQSERLRQSEEVGYIEGSSNLTELID
jgi:hypothetical protein